MDVKLVNPFVSAALEILTGELGAPVTRGALQIENSPLIGRDVTVLVGLAGGVKGVVMLNMNTQTVLRIAAHMSGDAFTELNELAKSAIAEVANMISGRAAADLEELGYFCGISAPTIIAGLATAISTTNFPRLVVGLETPCGELSLHVSIRPG